VLFTMAGLLAWKLHRAGAALRDIGVEVVARISIGLALLDEHARPPAWRLALEQRAVERRVTPRRRR
jgi:hypothetical protein